MISVRQQTETTMPADILLVSGTCIVNEAMLSGESTPLLKESIQLLDGSENLDVDGAHKSAVLFSGTKVLQSGAGVIESSLQTPDGGCLGVVLRTGFGTAQGQLVRTMIFSTERVSANNMESFLFIGFLLIFAIAASWYVWTKGRLDLAVALYKLLMFYIKRYRTGSQEEQVAFGLCAHYHECCPPRASDGTQSCGQRKLGSIV